jgi:hypothetical protein
VRCGGTSLAPAALLASGGESTRTRRTSMTPLWAVNSAQGIHASLRSPQEKGQGPRPRSSACAARPAVAWRGTGVAWRHGRHVAWCGSQNGAWRSMRLGDPRWPWHTRSAWGGARTSRPWGDMRRGGCGRRSDDVAREFML